MLLLIVLVATVVAAFLVYRRDSARPLSPTRSYEPLSDRVQTLARYGATKTEPMLAQVIDLTQKIRVRVVSWFGSLILERDVDFSEWWQTTEVNDRKRRYVGRHRDYPGCAWRVHWASYDTSEWPTLNTSGCAFDMITDETLTVDEWAEVMARNERVLAHVG